MRQASTASGLVLATSMLTALALATPGADDPVPPKRRYVVAAIGDSLTDPRSGGGKYLRELGRRCPESRFDAYGVGGQQTIHMRWRFAHDVLGRDNRRPPPKYTHVIVMGGVNDVMSAGIRHAPIARTQQNLSFMYRSAKQSGVQVVAVTIPPWGRLEGVDDARARATDRLNRWILSRPVQAEADRAVDIRPALVCGDPRSVCPKLRRYADDYVHWNEPGHRSVADVLHREAFADCR